MGGNGGNMPGAWVNDNNANHDLGQENGNSGWGGNGASK